MYLMSSITIYNYQKTDTILREKWMLYNFMSLIMIIHNMTIKNEFDIYESIIDFNVLSTSNVDKILNKIG